MKKPDGKEPRNTESAAAASTSGSSNANKLNLKAIQSIKHEGKCYLFEKELGKGVQSTVWLFSLED